MRKIKSQDQVVVLVGKSKGLVGKVMSVLEKGQRVLVQGANMVCKHVKVNPQKGTGGRVLQEAPIHISNVAIYNPATKKADKVRIHVSEEGKKTRVFKSNNELIDQGGTA